MKSDIHPTYISDAAITCACGNVMQVGATKKEMQVEICGACHPFYTGKEKLVDTAGRVEKFKAKVAKAAATPKKTIKKKREKNTATANAKK